MAYIPKNKIQTNLHTGIGTPTLNFATSNGEGYVGPYYKLYNGKYFSGRTPNDPNTQELFPVAPDGLPLRGNKTTPTFYSPLLPTPQDYQNGEFVRYFICRLNQPLFIEINKTTFDKYKQKDPTISWKLYKPFSLFWVLTGDINQVAQTNKNITELTEQNEKVDGLSIYLKEDWTQYYKSNL
jgi:hypothetical protein